jgi:hypothetical protein
LIVESQEVTPFMKPIILETLAFASIVGIEDHGQLGARVGDRGTL